MTGAVPRSIWAGRTVALLAIVLIALNLRTAVAAISPIVAFVSKDIPLGAVGFGVLGTLPPIAFASSGIVAPLVARRLGIETTMVLACAAMIVGPLVRAVAPNYAVLLVGSAVAFTGMGFGNILLPPSVKKYFPDRIGQLTAAYATFLSIGTALPPLLAIPIAAVAGWRVSVAAWLVFAVCALVPWVVMRARAGRIANLERKQTLVPEARADLLGRMPRSRTAIAMAIAFAVPTFNGYAFFAWLPELLKERAGSPPEQAGAILALLAITGLPLALVTPILASRMHNVGYIIWAGIAFFLVGYLGLLLVPTVVPWLWAVLSGLGSVIFPLCLAMIGLRTKSPDAAVALSGFVQGIGYGVGALGPLLFGILRDVSGGWTAPLVLVLAVTLVAIVPAVLLRTPSFVEDELAVAERL